MKNMTQIMEKAAAFMYLACMKARITAPGINLESRLCRASLLMEASNQDFLPIYDQFQPVGVITKSMVQERMKSYESYGPMDTLSVAHYMLAPVTVVSKHVTAEQLLREYTSRRPKAFLFMEDGVVQGVLTLEGLLLALATDPDASIEPFVIKWKDRERNID